MLSYWLTVDQRLWLGLRGDVICQLASVSGNLCHANDSIIVMWPCSYEAALPFASCNYLPLHVCCATTNWRTKSFRKQHQCDKIGKVINNSSLYSLLVMHVIDVVERLLMLSVSVLAFLQFYVMQA